MRRLLFCLALTVFAAGAQQNGDLSITWIGQSCFILRTVGGPTVITDPPVPSVGYTLGNLTADAVTISHNHTDHNNAAGISGQFALIDGRPVTARQQTTAAGVTFTLIPGFHDNQNGTVRGPNTMVRWTQAGLNIAHLGDLGQDQLTDAQLADLQGIDILFIPAGGFFTVTPDRAAAYAAQLNARITILMHYRTALGGPAQLSTLPDIGTPFGRVIYKSSSVVVHRDAMPVNNEIWAMQPVSTATAFNAAGFADSQPIAAGSVAAIFGSFTGSQTAPAGSYPLPRKIADTEVFVDGQAAPLYYVSPGQVNVQLPSAHAVGPVVAEVRVGGNAVGRAPVNLTSAAPGLFAAANRDGRANSAATPAHPGEFLTVYGTGFGAAAPAVADGVAASANPLSTGVTPNVFLDGRQLSVQFAGLAPGTAGVWQINVLLPADVETGPQLSLSMVSGIESNKLTVAIAR
jgi:uncharacterized protein (TIGR03437 family)